MALGDLTASRLSSQSSVALVSNHYDDFPSSHGDDALDSARRDNNSDTNHNSSSSSSNNNRDRDSDIASTSNYGGGNATTGSTAATTTSMAYLPQSAVLSELRHEAFEASVPTGPSDSGPVSKWRPKDRVRCRVVEI
jgi:regulator-associated protein of mTOR